MAGRRSKNKGARYEGKVAKIINDALGTNLRRTPASGGLGIKGDLRDADGPYLSGKLAGWVVEVKCQEKINIWKCIEQARDQAGNKKWLLAFSRNYEDDYVCMSIHDWLELIDKNAGETK